MEQLQRWRLILGKEVEEELQQLNDGEQLLSEEQLLMDKTLSEIYGSQRFSKIGANGEGSKSAGKGKSFPNVSKWFGDIQTLFDKDIVQIIQNDAIERCGLKELLLEPEILETIEPNISLASSLLALKDNVPQKSKQSVRIFIRKIVEDINKKLSEEVRKVISSQHNKNAHSPIPLASAIDFKYTIRKNLKNYSSELNTIIPEKVYFFDRDSKNDTNKWTIILDVDQSGSMGESVIYSSVLSCILASISSLKTKVVAFDDEVVDLTKKLDDPVDLLYGFNLGGGTNINKSLKYCQTLIENPSKTILFLVTDLYEGGNVSEMLQRLEFMKQSGVKVVCLLAISDNGTPCYDHQLAKKVGNLNIPCFACSPNNLPELLDCAINDKDMKHLAN
ncbi:MAG: hypothetical protein ATN36_04840 [Epulopiscium sp. Nele67-Bin005]|nr:MAG: hypothetical protein ATN36_04840 [Epulopiscium sp. Nele67-Bin005]